MLHRNVRSLANKLGVYSEKEGHLKITFASNALQKCKVPILVPSQMKKSAMQDMGHKAMTYAGCQGLTAPRVQILLDNHTTLLRQGAVHLSLQSCGFHPLYQYRPKQF